MSRVVAVLLIAAGIASGCGSSSSGTIGALLERAGPDVAVTAGATSFVPGAVRFPFLVIANDAKPVERPSAHVWVATAKNARPFVSTTAKLEPRIQAVVPWSVPAIAAITTTPIAQRDTRYPPSGSSCADEW